VLPYFLSFGRNITAQNIRVTTAGKKLRGYDAQEGCLPSAVWSQQSEKFTSIHFYAHTSQSFNLVFAVVRLAQINGFDSARFQLCSHPFPIKLDHSFKPDSQQAITNCD
jgi:hypothetical protein